VFVWKQIYLSLFYKYVTLLPVSWIIKYCCVCLKTDIFIIILQLRHFVPILTTILWNDVCLLADASFSAEYFSVSTKQACVDKPRLWELRSSVLLRSQCWFISTSWGSSKWRKIDFSQHKIMINYNNASENLSSTYLLLLYSI